MGNTAPVRAGPPENTDYSDTADDIKDLAIARAELARYAVMMPEFQAGLLQQAKQTISTIRKQVEDSQAKKRGASSFEAEVETMLADAQSLGDICLDYVLKDETDDADKKAKDVWKKEDELKKAVRSKNYQEAAKVQADLKKLKGPRYYPKKEDIDRLKQAEVMKEKLKSYISRMQGQVAALSAEQQWQTAAALKGQIERAEKARHPLLQ